MLDDRLGGPADLAKADQIVPHPVIPGVAVGRAERPIEAMDPSQERQAQGAPAGTAEFLVDIAFLAAEAAELSIEARPGGAAAGEQSQPMHGNVERRAIGIVCARVALPIARTCRHARP